MAEKNREEKTRIEKAMLSIAASNRTAFIRAGKEAKNRYDELEKKEMILIEQIEKAEKELEKQPSDKNYERLMASKKLLGLIYKEMKKTPHGEFPVLEYDAPVTRPKPKLIKAR